MIHVVLDPEAPFDQIGDAGTRPQVGRIAVGESAPQEGLLESRALRRSQLPRSPGNRKCTDPVASRGIKARALATHRATIHTHPTRDLDGQQAFLQQIERPQAAALQLGRTSGRAHRFPPVQEYGTLVMQGSIAHSIIPSGAP